MIIDENSITPEILYQILILKALIDMGGSAKRESILSLIKLHYSNYLSKKDLEDYESGHGERCANHISFARQHLKEKGYLARNSSYGIWEITPEGRQWLASLKNIQTL